VEAATASARLEPILKKELNECLGDEKSAAERANQILLIAGKLRGLTAFLRDLAERYPEPQFMGLSASSREKIAGLANRILGQMSETLENQDSLVVPILERADPSFTALGRAVDPSRGSRLDWQRDAESLFRLVSTNDKLVARLFAETTGFTREVVSPAEQIRSFINVDKQLEFFLLRRE
jgi:hypothetical protein